LLEKNKKLNSTKELDIPSKYLKNKSANLRLNIYYSKIYFTFVQNLKNVKEYNSL